ncbi:unnamed protein product [Meloidogyne enterolobii]|uniref:Uncharacterized protein n=1 Tax=Meloidogyne enterolobii TaxID=390850 RepID=A0ACB0YFC3_MELEN
MYLISKLNLIIVISVEQFRNLSDILHLSKVNMASPLSNESISRVKDMMSLPKEELFAKLQSEPLSFFKNLKELPDEYATVVYEAQSVMDSLTPRCKGREAYDYIEPLVDLVNKTTVGLEIKDDNEARNLSLFLSIFPFSFKDRKILFGHRLVIEARLIAEIDHVLDIALKISENLDPNNVSEDEGDNKIGVSFEENIGGMCCGNNKKCRSHETGIDFKRGEETKTNLAD